MSLVQQEKKEQVKTKRPEFVNGVRVRMPEGYDFSTKGLSMLT